MRHGIVVTLFVLNQLAAEKSSTRPKPTLIDAYDRLMAFADEHPEAGSIFQAID